MRDFTKGLAYAFCFVACSLLWLLVFMSVPSWGQTPQRLPAEHLWRGVVEICVAATAEASFECGRFQTDVVYRSKPECEVDMARRLAESRARIAREAPQAVVMFRPACVIERNAYEL